MKVIKINNDTINNSYLFEVNYKKLREVQLDLLKEFKRVCEKNGIRYYIACGTCLGAKRHEGFIPWDSDADIYMFWDDIKKLETAVEDFGENYFLQSRITDHCFDSIIYRLRNSKTTFITTDSVGLDINQGVWIDIYPLYYKPRNPISYHTNIILSYLLRLLVANHPPLNHGTLVRSLSKAIVFVISPYLRNEIIERIELRLKKPTNTNSVLTYYGLDITPLKALLYKSDWFKKPNDLLFESVYLSAPTDVDAYLTCKYGDYMVLPPETIDRVRAELLEGDARTIVSTMKQMGLSKEEALTLLETYWD